MKRYILQLGSLRTLVPELYRRFVRRTLLQDLRRYFLRIKSIEGTINEQGLRLTTQCLEEMKKAKLARIAPLLRTDMPSVNRAGCIDFLTDELRGQFNIVDTYAVSANGYDPYAMALIEKHKDGLILDCGAGKRSVYYENVVNFEIAAYETTDVRGVGEVLPFKDNCFDAVFSLCVLEHVKDPFVCAREIIRVLKPGGDLLCSVPFLQPMHGYPHHYYNMSEMGLRNLFASDIEVKWHQVYESVLPIWSLSWIIRSWADGLGKRAREEFLSLRLADFVDGSDKHLNRTYVRELPQRKNFELASATVLLGSKKA